MCSTTLSFADKFGALSEVLIKINDEINKSFLDTRSNLHLICYFWFWTIDLTGFGVCVVYLKTLDIHKMAFFTEHSTFYLLWALTHIDEMVCLDYSLLKNWFSLHFSLYSLTARPILNLELD